MCTLCAGVVLDMHHTRTYLVQATHMTCTLNAHRLHFLVTSEQMAWIDSQTTQYRKKSDVIRDLIDTARQGLTGGLDYAPTVSVREKGTQTPVIQLAETQAQPAHSQAVQVSEIEFTRPEDEYFLGDGVGKESEETPRKAPSLKEIPDDLSAYKDLIQAFWRVKQGSKGDIAWNRLMGQLKKFVDQYGDSVVRDQLELAINGKWKGIEVSRYEQLKPKGKSGEPEFKHPAFRDASDVIAESERLAQQNVEHLRRKEEERNTDGGVLSSLF